MSKSKERRSEPVFALRVCIPLCFDYRLLGQIREIAQRGRWKEDEDNDEERTFLFACKKDHDVALDLLNVRLADDYCI